jgi:hypothetical protein
MCRSATLNIDGNSTANQSATWRLELRCALVAEFNQQNLFNAQT